MKCLAYCEPIAKYDLSTNSWKKVNIGNQDKKRALSIVKYDTCFGKKKDDNNSEFEYFVIMGGMRPENFSETGNETGWGVKYFLPEFEKLDKKIKLVSILIDNDAPLEKQSELIAKYIEELKESEDCKKIHILGVSKCGTMLVALLKYLSNNNLEKLNLMAYSAPYLGTIFASPKSLYRRIDEVVGNVEDKLLRWFVYHLSKIKPRTNHLKMHNLADRIKSIHWNVFSQSHMDYDIAEIDGKGVPEKHKDRYDEFFLKDMFDEVTLTKLRKTNFTNITTFCTEQTLKNAILSHNVNAGMLALSNKIIFEDSSDGMVSLKSASYIEEICARNSIKITTLKIPDGHHHISSDPRIIKQIINDRVLYINEEEQIK